MTTIVRQRGIVLDRVSLQPLAEARVDAFDANGQILHAVARAVTDAQGLFELRMTLDEIEGLFGERQVDLVFRVAYMGVVVADTAEVVRWLPDREQPFTKIYCDTESSVEAGADTFVVSGRIIPDGSGSPPRVDIKVFDVRLSGDVLVAEQNAIVMPNHYSVSFAASAVISGKRLPDIKVQVWENEGGLLNESEIRFQAAPATVIDIAVNPTLVISTSEHDHTVGASGAVLGTTEPRSLSDAQIDQVAQSAEVSPTRVRALAKADAIAASFSGAISTEALYALQRQGMRETHEGLMGTRRLELRTALERAAEAGQTSLSTGQINTQLNNLRSEMVAVAQAAGGFGALLTAAGLSTGDRDDLLDAYMDHEGPPDAFWSSISLEPAAVSAAQTYLRIGALVGYHEPLLDALSNDTNWESFDDLAAFDEDAWAYLMKGTTLPGGLDGANEEMKRRNWAKLIVRRVASVMPTRYLAARVTGDRKTFLDNNLDFDFRKHRVATYFATESPNLSGISDVEALQQELGRTERLLKLTPRAEHVVALETAGFTSARSIARYGRARFRDDHAGALGGTAAAALLYNQAVRQAHKAAHLFAKLNPAINGPWMPFLANLDAPPSDGTMTLSSGGASSAFETYFGHPAFCACARCAAIHGPAAYFVALLVWLSRFPTLASKDGGSATALDLLLGAEGLTETARRPDLGYLELTCDNVDGALPYIDVVNEVLEWRVGDGPPEEPIGTGGTVEDRLGAPELRSEAAEIAFLLAYEKLSGTHGESVVYPFELPFSIWNEQTRIVLSHLGVARADLMEVLQVVGEPEAPTNTQIAIERLGIEPLSWSIISDWVAGALTSADFWGMGENAGWVSDLENVAIFMDRAKVASYDELVELLETGMVRDTTKVGSSNPTLYPHPATVRCDLSEVTIVELDDAEGFFKWMQTFVRLHHEIGWRYADIDKLMRFPSLDVAALAASEAEYFERELKIPRAESLAFRGDLDDHPMPASRLPSLVDRLFRAQSAGPLISDKLPFPLSGTISGYTQAIRAGLQIDAEGLALLTNASAAVTLFLAPVVEDDTLDLANLTTLFRHARLARALRLHVAELMVFVALSATSPFGIAGKPRELVREVRAFGAVGLSADTIHYLLRHVERPRRGVPSRAEEIEKHAAAVAAAADTVLSATKAPAKVTKDDLRGELYAALDAVVDPDTDPDARAARVAADTEYVLALVDDLSIEPSDASDRRVRLAAIFADVLDDPTPIAQFLVPEHPKDLSSCRVWCDAFDPYDPGTGDWDNQASGGATVGQSDGGNRPSLAEGPFGGVAFDGASHFLDVTVSYVDRSHTVAFAAAPAPATGARALLDVPERFICAAQTTSAGQVGYATGSTPDWHDVGPLQWGMHTLTFRFDGPPNNTAFAYRDGEPISTTANPFGDGLGILNARLGGTTTTEVEPFAGVIHAFGLFEGALGVTDLARVNGYLALLQERQQDRIAFVYRALRDVVHRREVVAATKKLASERFQISEAMGAHILASLNAVDTPENDATSLLDSLRTPSVGGHRFPDPGSSPGERVRALTRFSKVALLADTLGMNVLDVDWLLQRTEPGWLDLNALPVEGPPVETPTSDLEDASARYAGLLRLVDVYALARHFVDGRAGMYDISAAAADDPELVDFMALVAAQTRWEAADLSTLHARFHADLAPYVDLTGFLRLAPAAEAVRRLGVSAAMATGWIDPAESYADARATAREVLKAARAKHTAEEWSTIAPALRDPLREKQRAALVSHLVQTESLAGPEALYDELLIDVEMSACQKVSRIRAGLNSVQLFVHRAMLGLEPLWTPDKDARAQWEWRKIFTLWEANRKVFLYPEDFLDAGLHDRTPLFSQLEGDLRQGDLTEDRIERAYHRYLRGLEEVSALVPTGVFHEQQAATAEHPSVDQLHVFAQTPGGAPRTLYQRQFVDGHYWTPWEPVPLEANARHFLPLVKNGRKQLYWVESVPGQGVPSPPNAEAPAASMPSRVRLSMATFDGFEWSKPQLTDALDGETNAMFSVANIDPDADDLVALASGVYAQIEGYAPVVLSLETVAHYRFDPCRGDLGSPLAGGPQLDLPAPWVNGIDHGAFAQTFQLAYFDGDSPTTLLTSSGPTLSRFDMTTWRDGTTKLSVPRGSWFTFAGGRWLFIQRSPVPSANPNDYVAPPLMLMPGSEEISAQDLVDVQLSSYQLKVKVPLIALIDLNAAIVDAPIETSLSPGPAIINPKVRVRSFDHRLVCKVREVIHRHGMAGLRDYHRLSPTPLQELETEFFAALGPVSHAITGPHPKDRFDFELAGAYSAYNWELFFHVPLFIATRLRQEGRHQEALDWLHAVFDPREAVSSGDYKEVWKFRPFRELLDVAALKSEIDNPSGASTPFGQWLQQALGAAGAAAGADEDFEAQLNAIEKDPFNPHRLARMRPVAYQKYVVRLYVETLIEWGDKLFRRDTLESLVEAQQLYMLAGLVLGPQKPVVDAPLSVTPKTFFDVVDDLDALDNPLVAIEAIVPEPADGPDNAPSPAVDEVPILLFCVPPNERMTKLRDLLQDRLFKLRNCMNIEGVVRELPLFDPPIDPALLVRARAAGLDFDAILSDLYAPPPLHRFGVLYGRAVDFASFVVSLGQSLQGALEKRDAETLALLQSEQQVTLLERIRETRRAQIEEARENIAALRASRTTVEERLSHYEGLIAKGLIPAEESAQQQNERASAKQKTASMLELGAQMLHLIPDLNIGAAGMGPANFLSFGGTFFANALRVQSAALTMEASEARDRGAALSVAAGFTRRREDWELARDQATLELAAIDRQMIAAEVRLSIAERELESHELQIEQSKELREFYEDKYTREELYTWMTGELSALYHDAYKLAFDMARRAERAFQFERAAFDRRFIQFGHWEGSRKGLLAGERLLLELRRMDAAYLDSDRREREITKHFSLSEMAPEALLTLRETGSVTFGLVEDLFDLDYPGHYLRRIKSVSITLPAVTGPYSGINATLTLLSNKIRVSPAIGNGYEETPGSDDRFLYNFGAIQSICTSSGENDAGVFELRFDGERLLPFEGAGAISQWRLEIPQQDNRFDLSTLTDAVIHVQYMARDAGSQLRTAARAQVADKYPRAKRLVSARYELPDAWHAFIEGEGGEHVLSFTLEGRVPFIPGEGDVAVTAVAMVADFEPGTSASIPCELSPVTVAAPHSLTEALSNPPFTPDGEADETTTWSLTILAVDLEDPEVLRDIYFVFDLQRGGAS